MKKINLASRNGMWKGRNAGLQAIHIWVRARLPKTDLCQACNKVEPIDLANISQKYHRKLTDWEWLCRRCHMLKDGRLFKLSKYNIGKPGKKWTEEFREKMITILRKGSYFNCLICSNKFWRKPYRITKGHHKFCSKKCKNLSMTGDKNILWKGGRPKCSDCNKQLFSYIAKRCGSCASRINAKKRWKDHNLNKKQFRSV